MRKEYGDHNMRKALVIIFVICIVTLPMYDSDTHGFDYFEFDTWKSKGI